MCWGAVRQLNRLELVGETLRAALEQLAAVMPDWLAEHADPDWFDRYGRRIETFRLPDKDSERDAWAAQVGTDGWRLWQALTGPGASAGLTGLEQVELLRRVWLREYQITEAVVVMRDPKARPPAARRLVSPYDPDARTGRKRQTLWEGYKLHVTETCDPGLPRLITNVVTTPATGSDFDATDTVHTGLGERGLLPAEHLVDAGYVTAHTLTRATTVHNVELVGPALPDTTWQATAAEGYAATDFRIDWDSLTVACPEGQASTTWAPHDNRHGTPVIQVRFPATACQSCPARALCTTSTRHGRTLTLLPQPEHQALTRARHEQETTAWQEKYRPRAGVEATIGQAANALGARHARYRGQDKTQLQHQITAAALNLIRIDNWQTGTPLAPTRTSHLAALKPAA